jgi:hypothetical protein
MPRRHGPRALRRAVQRSFQLLRLFQGRAQGHPQEGVEGQAISSPEHAAGSPHDGGEKVSKPYGQDSDAVVAGKTERAEKAAQQVKRDSAPVSESETMVPKAWHSGIDADTEK